MLNGKQHNLPAALFIKIIKKKKKSGKSSYKKK